VNLPFPPRVRLNPPNAGDYLAFVRGVMGIPAVALPDDSQILVMSLGIALDVVNWTLARVAPNEYSLAVYNLAGDRLVNYAPDQPEVFYPGAPPYQQDADGENILYFAYLRKKMDLAGFTPGVVTSTSDEVTSGSLLNPEFMKTLSMADMQTLKTPWG
jgi:hypothetical protein